MPFFKHHISLRTLLLACPGILSVCSYHAEAFTGGKQAQCEVLRVSGAEEWFPFAYVEQGNAPRAKGIAHDVVRLIAETVDLELEVMVGVPWKRIEQEMAKGHIDLLAGNYWTNERNVTWLMTEAIASETVNLYTLAEKPFAFRSLTDLHGKRGVVPMGISLGQDFDTARQFIDVTEVRTHEQMYDMLQLERVDYLVSPRFAADRMIAKGLQRGVIRLDNPIDRYNVHLSFSRHSPCQHLQPAFNEAIRHHKQNGNIQTIIDQYVKE